MAQQDVQICGRAPRLVMRNALPATAKHLKLATSVTQPLYVVAVRLFESEVSFDGKAEHFEPGSDAVYAG